MKLKGFIDHVPELHFAPPFSPAMKCRSHSYTKGKNICDTINLQTELMYLRKTFRKNGHSQSQIGRALCPKRRYERET
jgi:hypothetical protein